MRREILKAETSGKNSYYNLTRRVELLSSETKTKDKERCYLQ